MMKLDVLAIAAHPDDVEISAAGTLLRCIDQGMKVGIIDLTRGELGTRGNGDLRLIEADKAAAILGLSVRENLNLGDGFFRNEEATLLRVIDVIRKYQPSIVLANAIADRHPDHGRASKLVSDACFYSGLGKIETNYPAWRPKSVYFFGQDYYQKPDFVVDITPYWEKKLEALKAYSSQFFDPNNPEPSTPISGEEFFDFIKARNIDFGRPAGYRIAEGFCTARVLGVNRLTDIE
jgi:bacillithiol biosynthesis deacetylase BshB1